MVRVSGVNLVQQRIKRIAHFKRGPFYNHRVPVEYQRFQANLKPKDVVERYSKDEYFGRKDLREQHVAYNFVKASLLPDLTKDDLRRNQIFQDELDRQRAMVARVQKIKIMVESQPGKGKILMMNKDISTPFDCARHISELVMTRSAIAEILPLAEEEDKNSVEKKAEDQKEDKSEISPNQQPNKLFWDMHRPLEKSCTIKLRHFDEEDADEVNKAYWRSCSFILGIGIRRAFKEGVKIMLHSWPKPDIKSGSFVYDVAMNLRDIWAPTDQELRAFSKLLWDIREGSHRFERLTTGPDTAMLMFDDNNFKLQQIHDICLNNEKKFGRRKVDLYRCGGYIDISVGPMISHTGQIGRISLASVHQLDHHIGIGEDDATGLFYRFQGISLPRELHMNSFVYQNVLINRAKRLNIGHEINE